MSLLRHGPSPGSFLLGIVPPGTVPPGSVPPGNVPPGKVPPGKVLLGSVPPGIVPPGRVPPGNVPPGSVPPGNVPPGGVLSRPERPLPSPAFPERTVSGMLSGLIVWFTSESAGPAPQFGDGNIADKPITRKTGVIRFITARATSHEQVLASESETV